MEMAFFRLRTIWNLLLPQQIFPKLVFPKKSFLFSFQIDFPQIDFSKNWSTNSLKIRLKNRAWKNNRQKWLTRKTKIKTTCLMKAESQQKPKGNHKQNARNSRPDSIDQRGSSENGRPESILLGWGWTWGPWSWPNLKKVFPNKNSKSIFWWLFALVGSVRKTKTRVFETYSTRRFQNVNEKWGNKSKLIQIVKK